MHSLQLPYSTLASEVTRSLARSLGMPWPLDLNHSLDLRRCTINSGGAEARAEQTLADPPEPGLCRTARVLWSSAMGTGAPVS